MHPAPFASGKTRRGIALGMVVLMGLVVLALGTIMIATSGGLLRTTVDAKGRLRARYAAEAMVAVQIARLDAARDRDMGGALDLPAIPLTDLQTGNGERAKSDALKRSSAGGQEKISSGLLKGLMGVKIPFLVQSTGLARGGAKAAVQAEVYLYQVPIFQFGVFYEGNLEITPGPYMSVGGPVHTNGNAYFRAKYNNLHLQGPVTAVGSIYHWKGGGSPNIYYNPAPDVPATTPAPGVGTSITQATDASLPGPVGGVWNVRQGVDRLELPIGGASAHDLIKPCTGTEAPSLARQKFACLAGVASYVEGATAQPSWVSDPRVFFDRRENRWVFLRDVDVVAALNGNPDDSIFYVANQVLIPRDSGAMHLPMINAFRLVNAVVLPRNVSVVSANPIYIQGNFNTADPAGSCGPVGVASVPDSLKYCNAMIAADAVTLISPEWPNWSRRARGMDGSLEQPFDSLDHWTSYVSHSGSDTVWANEPGPNSAGVPGFQTIRVNAAILTGNKPSNPLYLAPNSSLDATFEANYEGGWHNTIRFLENLGGSTVEFKGSFVCMWKADTPGLDTASNHVTIKRGHYSPPNRVWGYDSRFKDINNMPPGTPFLSTGVFTNWSERR
ncbi:MAG: pilus assembly PilX N-terminal domain-containing protein [Fibrobacteria bacterium]|nr:pilus assembly PilX N-terminal domain-containing protein [Fibrobacteria bacterium]